MTPNPCPICKQDRHLVMKREPDKSLTVDCTCVPDCNLTLENKRLQDRVAVLEREVKHLEAGI